MKIKIKNYISFVDYLNFTMTGYLDYDSPNVDELLRDERRVKYFHDHLYYLYEAIE